MRKCKNGYVVSVKHDENVCHAQSEDHLKSNLIKSMLWIRLSKLLLSMSSCLFSSSLCVLSCFFYYIPITDTTLELSVFWPSDTESRINELRLSESISLSFKTRLTSVTCYCGDVT